MADNNENSNKILDNKPSIANGTNQDTYTDYDIYYSLANSALTSKVIDKTLKYKNSIDDYEFTPAYKAYASALVGNYIILSKEMEEKIEELSKFYDTYLSRQGSVGFEASKLVGSIGTNCPLLDITTIGDVRISDTVFRVRIDEGSSIDILNYIDGKLQLGNIVTSADKVLLKDGNNVEWYVEQDELRYKDITKHLDDIDNKGYITLDTIMDNIDYDQVKDRIDDDYVTNDDLEDIMNKHIAPKVYEEIDEDGNIIEHEYSSHLSYNQYIAISNIDKLNETIDEHIGNGGVHLTVNEYNTMKYIVDNFYELDYNNLKKTGMLREDISKWLASDGILEDVLPVVSTETDSQGNIIKETRAINPKFIPSDIFDDIDFSSITDRIKIVESKVDKLVNNHISYATCHVSTTDRVNWNGKYKKPVLGIPMDDLSDEVIMKINNGGVLEATDADIEALYKYL